MEFVTGFVIVSCVVFGMVSLGQMLGAIPIDKNIDELIPHVRKPFN